MSRELLKRWMDAMLLTSTSININPLMEETEKYLSRPEPEPMAYCYLLIDDDGDEVNRLGFTVPDSGFGAIPLYLFQPNYEAIKAERDELKARIDGGYRVDAWATIDDVICANNARERQLNATLILDEGVKL